MVVRTVPLAAAAAAAADFYFHLDDAVVKALAAAAAAAAARAAANPLMPAVGMLAAIENGHGSRRAGAHNFDLPDHLRDRAACRAVIVHLLVAATARTKVQADTVAVSGSRTSAIGGRRLASGDRRPASGDQRSAAGDRR